MIFIKTFINKVKISIFDTKKYDELIKERLSSAIIYALLISIILGSLVGGYTSYVFNNTKDKIINILEEDENKFSLKEGILNFDNSPKKYEKGKFILYIDTNKEKSEIESLRSTLIHKDYSIAVLKDGIVVDIDGYKQESNFIKDNDILDNKDIIYILNKLGFVGGIIFVIVIVQIFIEMIIDALLLSIIAQLISRIENVKIKYKDTVKICIYAVTLVTIINKIVYLGSIGFLVSGFYIIMIMKNLRGKMV